MFPFFVNAMKVPFFIHCINFSVHLELFEHSKEFSKFCIVGKPLPSGTSQWKIFWKKKN